MSIASDGASRFDASLLSSLNSPKIALQTLCRPVGQAVSNVSLGRATLALMDNNLLDDWFTKSQAAAVLQVSEKTVERMAHKGEIRRETHKRPGLRPLPVYSPEDLDRVKAAQVPQMAVLPPQAEAGGVPALAPRVDLPSFNRSYLVRTCRCLTSLKSVSSMKLHRDIGVSQSISEHRLSPGTRG